MTQSRRSKRSEAKAHKTASAPIVVKSIPDAKPTDRFYTTIRLPREMWDQAGFRPDDRVRIDWTGKTLSIGRDPEVGVKPKSAGGATVVPQSRLLGDLSFDQARITSGITSLRLTALPSNRDIATSKPAPLTHSGGPLGTCAMGTRLRNDATTSLLQDMDPSEPPML